jgi:2'-5' RNA ligase
VDDRFASFWERRSEIQPYVMKSLIDSDWSKGRNQFLVFLVKIKDENLIKKIGEVQEELSTIPCVHLLRKEPLHITVKGCGFLVESVKQEDEVLKENLPRIIDQAREILRKFSKFDVLLARPNIFPDVVFVEVHDGGKIGELNRTLQLIPEIKKIKFDYPNFLPHISIALFKNSQQFTKLVSRLEKLRNTEFGTMTIDSIELLIAHLDPRRPKLETKHTFRLR